MAKALILLAEGFEEIEAVTVADVLRRAEVAVTLAGLSGTTVRGAHEIVVEADTTLDAVQGEAFDAVILPGGGPGADRLREDARVLELLRRYAAADKWVAAICAAPIALEAAGVIAGKRVACYPGEELPSAKVVTEPVVRDGKIITSRGPATALAFALELVAVLVGAEAAAMHREKMLVAAP